jgi:hypothetical protein
VPSLRCLDDSYVRLSSTVTRTNGRRSRSRLLELEWESYSIFVSKRVLCIDSVPSTSSNELLRSTLHDGWFDAIGTSPYPQCDAEQDFRWATLLRRDGDFAHRRNARPRPGTDCLPTPQNFSSHSTGMVRLFVYARRAWHGAAQRGIGGKGGAAGSETRGGVR